MSNDFELRYREISNPHPGLTPGTFAPLARGLHYKHGLNKIVLRSFLVASGHKKTIFLLKFVVPTKVRAAASSRCRSIDFVVPSDDTQSASPKLVQYIIRNYLFFCPIPFLRIVRYELLNDYKQFTLY